MRRLLTLRLASISTKSLKCDRDCPAVSRIAQPEAAVRPRERLLSIPSISNWLQPKRLTEDEAFFAGNENEVQKDRIHPKRFVLWRSDF
jgi:hypothetical protein